MNKGLEMVMGVGVVGVQLVLATARNPYRSCDHVCDDDDDHLICTRTSSDHGD